MGKLLDFYSGMGTDAAGRTIWDVMEMGDDAMEEVHDYVQWLYPNRQSSTFCRNAPVLSDGDIRAFRREHREIAQKAVDKFTAFLRRTTRWRRPHDHNHLRVTRIIKFCREVGISSAELTKLVMEEPNVSCTSMSYWRDALL